MTVRLSPSLHALIGQSAEAEGVTFAQYLREAAIMRAAWEVGREETEAGRTDAVREGYRMIRKDWLHEDEG